MKKRKGITSSILLFTLFQIFALGTPLFTMRILHELLPNTFTNISFPIISVATLILTIGVFIYLCKHLNKKYEQNINYGKYFITGITVSTLSIFITVFAFAFIPEIIIYPITRTWSRFIHNVQEALFVFGILSVGLVIEFIIVMMFYEKFSKS